MKTDELIKVIDLYFDNELEKKREVVLFTSLSQDAEAREYFKKRNLLHGTIENSLEDFPSKLDENILFSIAKTNSTQTSAFINKKVFSVITYSAAIILLVLTIFFYSKSEEYKVQFYDLTREVKKQNDKLELLMNTLPEVEVTGGYVRTKQITVRSNL